jgi:hypothetical protein
MAKGYGDRLAKGNSKASFPASEAGISQDKFDLALGDFDPKEYLRKAEAAEQEAREQRAARLVQEQAESDKLDQERAQRLLEMELNVEPMSSTTEIGGGYVGAEITRRD